MTLFDQMNFGSTTQDPYNYAKSFVPQWQNAGGTLSREQIYGRLSDAYGTGRASDLVYKSGLFPDMPYKGGTPATPAASPTYGGGGYGGTSQVYAPALDVGSIYAQARSQVAPEVSGYYQGQLNQFFQQKALKRQQKQFKYEADVKEYEKTLKDFLEQSGITRGRTEEDVATNLGQLREDEITRQLGEGRGFDIGLRGLRDYLGTAGLTRSGLGRQQIAGAKEERKFAEEGAVKEVGRKTQAQEIYRTRTLGDLARGEKLKGEETTMKKERGKRELVDMEKMIDYELEYERSKSVYDREQETQRRAKDASRTLYLNWLGRVKDPAIKKAAREAYEGYF